MNEQVASTAQPDDERFMRLALALGRRNLGNTWPNPAVGAVIVKDGVVIARGWTQEGCRPHAEVEALRRAKKATQGATMYVSVEPCAHHGRQPPCTDAILAAGLARVVIGADDPSEKASGRGPGILRDGGVEVVFADDAAAAAARLANQAFRKHARTGRPLSQWSARESADEIT